ncbi:MAG: cytochrome c oxidase subunit I, partial [bacterium]
VINIVVSRRFGRIAGPNPWHAATLEWAAPSPPPHGNFAVLPTVYRGPYEYSVPGEVDDVQPQDQPPSRLSGRTIGPL